MFNVSVNTLTLNMTDCKQHKCNDVVCQPVMMKVKIQYTLWAFFYL